MRVITNVNKIDYIDCGEANGYLVIDDKYHPWFGKHYDDISVDVHGGLTYSKLVDSSTVKHFDEITENDIGYWIIGFDTCHSGDSYSNWPEIRVRQHAETCLLDVANNPIAINEQEMLNTLATLEYKVESTKRKYSNAIASAELCSDEATLAVNALAEFNKANGYGDGAYDEICREENNDGEV
jgi:hypothetical protein